MTIELELSDADFLIDDEITTPFHAVPSERARSDARAAREGRGQVPGAWVTAEADVERHPEGPDAVESFGGDRSQPQLVGEALYRCGRLERNAGRPWEAVENFKAALHHVEPNSVLCLCVYRELSELFRALGDPEEAAYYYRRSSPPAADRTEVARDPDMADLREALLRTG